MGDTTREANSQDVTDLKKGNDHLKQLVAEIALKNHVLKKVCMVWIQRTSIYETQSF